MTSQGLPVDIGPTESDSAYLSRLASYTPLKPVPDKAWSFVTVTGSGVFSSNGPNLTITRIGTGQYGVALAYPTNNSNYAVIFNGSSGSVAPTASLASFYNQTTTNFSMSTVLSSAPTVLKDFTTGSIAIFNN